MTDTIDFDEMNRKIIAEFRANGGKAGGMFAGVPLVLVHHTGAKSGIERIAPLAALLTDDRIFIFASKGGADENPAWYHNLVANPKTTVEFGTEHFPVTARVLTGTVTMPQFAEYQRKTSRVIPVIELQRDAA